MELTRLITMIAHRAGLITQDHKTLLRQGIIKPVLKDLTILNVKKPDDVPLESWIDALSKAVQEKWRDDENINISYQIIKSNLIALMNSPLP